MFEILIFHTAWYPFFWIVLYTGFYFITVNIVFMLMFVFVSSLQAMKLDVSL